MTERKVYWTSAWYFPGAARVPYWPPPREHDLQWLKDNNYEINLTAYRLDYLKESLPSSLTELFDQRNANALTLCSEYDLPVTFNLNEIFYPYSYGPDIGYLDPNITDMATAMTLPGTYFEEKYGAVFDAIEEKWGPGGTDGDSLAGYWCESWCDPNIEWMRNRQAREGGSAPDIELRQGIYHTMWYYAGWAETFIGNGHETRSEAIDRRVSMVDGVDIELWCRWDVIAQTYRLDECAKYLRDTFGDSLSIGLNGLRHLGPLATGNPGVMWSYNPVGDGVIYNFEQQDEAFRYYSQCVKDKIGWFDILQIQMGNGSEREALFDWTYGWMAETTPHWWDDQKEQMLYWEQMRLTEEYEKPVWDVVPHSFTPTYAGAATCKAARIDKFVNTGNELIILKDVGAASIHNITVTSTDTLTHEDYTLSLSPNRGTILGPYRLEDYGEHPTITYDTTNLYVSVLKMGAMA